MEIEKTMFIQEIEAMLDNKKLLREIVSGGLHGVQTRYYHKFISIQNCIDDAFRAAHALNLGAAQMIREWDKDHEKDEGKD